MVLVRGSPCVELRSTMNGCCFISKAMQACTREADLWSTSISHICRSTQTLSSYLVLYHYPSHRHSWPLTYLTIAPDEQASLAIRCMV